MPPMVLERWRARAATLERQVHVLGHAARDPRTPPLAKLILAGTVAYAASPIDPLPDFVPVLGYLDELVVVPLGAALALRLTPEPVLADARERADESVAAGRGRRAVAALTVATWLLVALFVLRALGLA